MRTVKHYYSTKHGVCQVFSLEKTVSNFQGVSFRKTVSNFQVSIPWREAPPGPPDAPTDLGLLGQLHAAVPMGRPLFHVKQPPLH